MDLSGYSDSSSVSTCGEYFGGLRVVYRVETVLEYDLVGSDFWMPDWLQQRAFKLPNESQIPSRQEIHENWFQRLSFLPHSSGSGYQCSTACTGRCTIPYGI